MFNIDCRVGYWIGDVVWEVLDGVIDCTWLSLVVGKDFGYEGARECDCMVVCIAHGYGVLLCVFYGLGFVGYF